VVGLHFFNPVPVMRLVEVVSGEGSSTAAVATARAVGEAMGKRVIEAADVAGFLVNRCNRPFSLESLKLLQERMGTVEQIDRVVRLGGGFRMGPFELMDLIGIDTNHAVAEAFHRQTYGEPRYRPSPLAARKIAAGQLGRKAGRGWYAYEGGSEHRAPDPEPPAPGGGEGRVVVVAGGLPLARELLDAAANAGFDARQPGDVVGSTPWLVVDCGSDGESAGVDEPRARLLHRGSLHVSDPSAVGFHALGPFDSCGLVELTTTPETDPLATERMETLVRCMGRHAEHVGDAPGLVVGRIVCQLINEAAFLIGEGNATVQDVNAGMELGVNHPRGPIAWSRATGLDHVVSVLDALHGELGEERYRVAPLLRRRAALGQPLG
jgi:3-hydroxybutyryl-CoA dehydrogenase